MKKIWLVFLLLFNIGCATDYNQCQISNPQYKKILIEGSGQGVAPSNVSSMPAAIAMARKAAILDAYKSLAEKIYGIRINGKDSVRNLVLQNSSIKATVNGIIKNAVIEEESFKNGIYYVQMSVKIDPNIWNQYINN